MNLAEKGIIIRKTAESDLREIYLSSAENPELRSCGFTAEHLADLFASEESIMFSAVRKKRVLGFITGSLREGEAEVETVFVREKFRGSGIGSSLIENFIRRAKKCGADNFFIAVHEKNANSIKFFRGNGFTAEGSAVYLRRTDS